MRDPTILKSMLRNSHMMPVTSPGTASTYLLLIEILHDLNLGSKVYVGSCKIYIINSTSAKHALRHTQLECDWANRAKKRVSMLLRLMHARTEWGPFDACPYTKSPTILGSVLRPLIFGNSQTCICWCFHSFFDKVARWMSYLLRTPRNSKLTHNLLGWAI